MYVFTRKWAEAADFRDVEHWVKIPAKPDGKTGEKRRECLRIPLKMSKFISNFNHGAIWITCN